MELILSLDRASILYDGTLTETRLKPPECVAVASDGAVWCGSEGGEIYRIQPDGSGIEVVASTGGFSLGIAFNPDGNLFTCDLAHRCIYQLKVESGHLARWATGDHKYSLKIPAGQLALYIDDPDAHTLCHPTNCAFRGTELLTSNLGRWHVISVDAGVEGAPLH